MVFFLLIILLTKRLKKSPKIFSNFVLVQSMSYQKHFLQMQNKMHSTTNDVMTPIPITAHVGRFVSSVILNVSYYVA